MDFKEKTNLIVRDLHDSVFQKISRYESSIFLIGSSLKKKGKKGSNLREKLHKALSKRRFFFGFDVYYPELIFDELLQGKVKFDLLTLENMLAESVQAVVIILESPGAIAELGAFANNVKFSQKLIVIVDIKYKRAKSFIKLGLIEYLKKNTNSRIIYHDLDDPKIDRLTDQIGRDFSQVISKVNVDDTLANPIALQYFFMAVLFIFGPLTKSGLDDIYQLDPLIKSKSFHTQTMKLLS